MIKKVKNTAPWTYVINDIKGEKIIGTKETSYMSNGKDMIIHSIAGLIKETKPFGGNINVKVDLFNYAGKCDLKDATGIDTFNFSLKSNLASLKTEVDKIDAEKLKTVPVDLSKISNVVNNDVVKKTVYDKLVTKVNNIDISGFVS